MEGAEAKRVERWVDWLERAAGFDTWGQVIEANDEYEALSRDIRAAMDDKELVFDDARSRFLNRTMIASTLRATATTDLTGRVDGISLEDISAVIESLKSVLAASDAGAVPDFPVEIADIKKYLESKAVNGTSAGGDKLSLLNSMSATATTTNNNNHNSSSSGINGSNNNNSLAAPSSPLALLSESEDEDGKGGVGGSGGASGSGEGGDGLASQSGGGKAGAIEGTLIPRPHFPGQTVVAIQLERIELKDYASYIMPFFTVSIKDGKGKDLCPPQDTPQRRAAENNCLLFDATVYIPLPLEQLPSDVAIFFELKHYKAKKKKTSVRCYSFMELDELQNQSAPLELYKKPTDFKRAGRPNLLTNKKHYLYTTCMLESS